LWIKTKCVNGEVQVEIAIPRRTAIDMFSREKKIEGEVIDCKQRQESESSDNDEVFCEHMLGEGCLIDTYFDGEKFY